MGGVRIEEMHCSTGCTNCVIRVENNMYAAFCLAVAANGGEAVANVSRGVAETGEKVEIPVPCLHPEATE